MTTIIRIEHTTGWGLWRAHLNPFTAIIEELECFNEVLEKHKNMPTVINDPGLGSRNTDEFCAFKSIEEFNQWMDKAWMPELVDNDFKVLMIDVSECRIGQYQVVFKKEHILQTKDITSLFL